MPYGPGMSTLVNQAVPGGTPIDYTNRFGVGNPYAGQLMRLQAQLMAPTRPPPAVGPNGTMISPDQYQQMQAQGPQGPQMGRDQLARLLNQGIYTASRWRSPASLAVTRGTK
jgi:hypothetical protein